MTLRSLLALLFATAGVAVLFVGQPIDLADIKAAAIPLLVAAFIADSSKIWALLERVATKVLGPKEPKA